MPMRRWWLLRRLRRRGVAPSERARARSETGVDEVRVAVAEQVDGDAGGKIEIARAIFGNQVAMLALHGAYAAPGIDRHERGDGHGNILRIES